MTRWARAGSSQKHKKMPEDSTPWDEFWKNGKQKDKADSTLNKVKSVKVEKKWKQKRKIKPGDAKKLNEGFEMASSDSKTVERKPNLKNTRQNESPIKYLSKEFPKNNEEMDDKGEILGESLKKKKHLDTLFGTQSTSAGSVLSKSQLKKAKRKAKLQELRKMKSDDAQSDNDAGSPKRKMLLNVDFSKQKNSLDTESTSESNVLSENPLKRAKFQESRKIKSDNAQKNIDGNSPPEIMLKIDESSKQDDSLGTGGVPEVKVLSKAQLKRAKKKARIQEIRNAQNGNDIDRPKRKISENDDLSKQKDFQGKKKLFMQRLEKKRQQNGILLLPSKVERKIYLIKKRLREKGLPGAVIKDVARKERRKEELKFRKTFNTKPCFNCRQMGHLLAECPLPLGDSNQETGICFKCGSTEHTSYKCPKKVEGYPFAKCFVCKEEGHISKDCPQNKHGVYPKGGNCSLCGNVNHLKKDCPTIKKEHEEESFTLHTINEGKSVDAEIIDEEPMAKKRDKKTKIVKF